jgi:septal ring factor EnvC (AmiA/AmiB activator)
MSINDDQQEIAQLRTLNKELKASLARCHALLDDARHKLAANSNEPEQPDEDEDTRLA